MDMYAIRNKKTGRFLVLSNDSSIEYVPYSPNDEQRIEMKFDLFDSEFTGVVFVTSRRREVEELASNGKARDTDIGDIVVYNSMRYLDQPNDGRGNFALSDLEIVALHPAG